MAAGIPGELKQCPWHTWSMPQHKWETPKLSQRGTLRQFLDEQNTLPVLCWPPVTVSGQPSQRASRRRVSWDGKGGPCLQRVLISLVTSHELPVPRFFTCVDVLVFPLCHSLFLLPIFFEAAAITVVCITLIRRLLLYQDSWYCSNINSVIREIREFKFQ